MPRLNDRPTLMGTHGMITSGHYLGTAAGHRIAMKGGNAVDIAAAIAFSLSVTQPHEYTIGGEVPTLVYSARERKTYAISGVGWAPRAFTIDWCREHSLDLIPGDGYLAAMVPAVVGTWIEALKRFGTMKLADVLAPAMELCADGFPMYPALRRNLLEIQTHVKELYPTTWALYYPGGRVPLLGERVRNPDLAATFKALVRAEAKASGKSREAGLDAACDAFYRGDVAKRIVAFINEHPVRDVTGQERAGLLALEDLAEWRATVEEPVTFNYRGLDVFKCPSWTQGPVFLQQLALLEGYDLRALGHLSEEYIHTWVECAKLAYADREAYYGDPAFDDVPFDVLLSKEYARRRELVGQRASLDQRPGDVGCGLPSFDLAHVRADNRRALGLDKEGAASTGKFNKDTTHLDVVDAAGNMVASTPSGGWISASPVLAGLGFPLGTRGQMFYLNAARPNALAPHKRPRATLTPTIVTKGGAPHMALGMRGGDLQDQISLHFFVNHVDLGMDVQKALDAPSFWISHFASSFYPRTAQPGLVCVDDRIDHDVLEALRERGHRVSIQPEIRHNVMGIRVDAEKHVLMGGVASTGEEAYALGW